MKKNSDVFSEVIVGVFMVAVLALLVYFTVVISGVDIMMGRTKTVATIAFTDVGGLKERDNVVYRGMKVGVVESIELAKSNVTVRVNIDSDVVLRETCRASVAATSLLGGNYLLLEEGTGEVRPLETTVFKGDPAMDWMRDLGRIASCMNDILAEGNLKTIISNFEETSENVKKIIARVERGEGTAGKFLSSDDTVYQDIKAAVADAKDAVVVAKRAVEDAEKTFAGARKTFDNASAISERLNKGEGTMGRLLSSDDKLYKDLMESVANVRSATEKLKNGEGLLGRAFNDETLAEDTSKLVSNLKAFSERLEKGEGTIGKLTSESALYDEISALVKDIRQIVDNYRDTTPITTFGSLATGAL